MFAVVDSRDHESRAGADGWGSLRAAAGRVPRCDRELPRDGEFQIYGTDPTAALRRSCQLAPKARTEPPIRSQLTPPERRSFEPTPLRAPPKTLIHPTSDIRTKMAVVRLRQRKGAERGGKRPEMDLSACLGGSDTWPGRPVFCGIPAVALMPKRQSRRGVLAEGEELSSNPLCVIFQRLTITHLLAVMC
jgi:hypothetical protein